MPHLESRAPQLQRRGRLGSTSKASKKCRASLPRGATATRTAVFRVRSWGKSSCNASTGRSLWKVGGNFETAELSEKKPGPKENYIPQRRQQQTTNVNNESNNDKQIAKTIKKYEEGEEDKILMCIQWSTGYSKATNSKCDWLFQHWFQWWHRNEFTNVYIMYVQEICVYPRICNYIPVCLICLLLHVSGKKYICLYVCVCMYAHL